MKRYLCLILAAGIAATAFATDPADKEFRAFYRTMLPRIAHAFETKDGNFFRMISAPGFTDSDGHRTLNAKESIGEIEAMFHVSQSIRCHFYSNGTKATGNTGVAMTFGHMDTIMKPEKPNAKPHRLSMDMWIKQTWIRSGNTWKLLKMEQSKPARMKMDGKPMDPSKMGG